MKDYKKMYYMLFNEITEIIERLKYIQQKAEEVFIEDDVYIELFKDNKD